MRYLIVSVILAGLLSAWGVSPAAAAARKTTAAEVMGALRSVTCEGERLEDCKADASAELRDHVKERVAAGWSKQKILNEAAETYGPLILLAPPKTGFALWLWTLPFAAVIIAGIFISIRSAGWAKEPAVAAGAPAAAPNVRDNYTVRVAEELKDFDR